ncbi:MAG: rSAM/selenodomain-associated transferase 2 [Cyclobacteriaceae bacterium]|jgi:rSAM/selenodomain-associated transferase 2
MTFSIVIPTLNEADNIQKCLDHALKCDDENPPQIIVVDAGSIDKTCDIVIGNSTAMLIEAPQLKGLKYASLNLGAAQADGDVIVFLDADTLLPKNYQQQIESALSNTSVVGGAFEHYFDKWTFFLRIVHLINRVRYRLSHRFYGDQAVFCRSKVFKKIGGYPEINIMESARFCDRMKGEGKLCLIKSPILTSSRRFLEQGQFLVFFNDFRIWLMDLLGLSLNEVGKMYWLHNETK